MLDSPGANFTLTDVKNYQVLTVKQAAPGAKPETYVLVRCGTPAPALTGDLAGAVSVETSIERLFSASNTHLPFITDLDVLERLTGVSSAVAFWQRVATEIAGDGESPASAGPAQRSPGRVDLLYLCLARHQTGT